MRRMLTALAVSCLTTLPVTAQQLTPPGTGGVGAIDRALSHAATNKRVLVIGAHPDDESNELMTLLSRGMGVEVAYLSLSRGEGGQNLIGTELGEGLGLVRSGELLAARAVDGGRQYFTRAFDFGFSKSIEETDRFWPRDTTFADAARVMRRFRPQVIVSVFSGTPRDGHGQHQQSGVIARQVFTAFRDSTWGPRRLYQSAAFDTIRTTLRLASGLLDPIEGKSYVQLAAQSRSQHRSQDMGAIQRLGPGVARLTLVDAVELGDGSPGGGGNGGPLVDHGLWSGVDTTLAPALRRYRSLIDSARTVLGPRSLGRVQALLERALAELRRHGTPEFRARKESLVEEALAASAGIVVDPAADDGFVVPGQALQVALSIWSAGETPLNVRDVVMETPAGWSTGPGIVPPQQPVSPALSALSPSSNYVIRRYALTPPPEAPLTEPYFLVRPRRNGLYDWSSVPDSLRGEPFDPPLLSARVTLDVGGTLVTLRREVSWRYNDQARGEVRRPVFVAPAVGVAATPELLVWPAGNGGSRAVTVELVHGVRGTTQGEIRLELPAGWPDVAAQRFTLEGEGTRRSFIFHVQSPAALPAGSYQIHAVASAGHARYDRATALIDYPHLRPVQYTSSAAVRIHATPLVLPALRSVGYVRGASDLVPEALGMIGVPVRVLSAHDLERADLSQFDVIVIGSRAYETEPALAANNDRLLDYARAGGRVIVQYQQYQFINGRFAPFPLAIARPHDRVTDENAPVRVLEPSSPLFTTPNPISDADWLGWTQERGLYFARSWHSAYRPLLEMTDAPFTAAGDSMTAAGLAAREAVRERPLPAGPSGPASEALRGGLLVARLGRGLYVYTGLSFFRQLPAGVPGAYRLFVNLLGLEPANVP